MANWYEINDCTQLDSPALVVFTDRVQHNIAEAIKMIGDVTRLRPHVKTHKSAQATALLLQAGITKFKCATIAEAEMLAQCQAPDVLLAYQPTGPKLQRFINLIKKYPATQFSCLTDNIVAATEQSAAFAAAQLTIPVFIDLNVGMNRTGILPNKDAIALANQCKALDGMLLKGLHAYDGHIRDTDFATKKEKCDVVYEQVITLNNQLQLPVIIMGGSPSFSVHCKRNNIECSPGTFIYWDKGYSHLCSEQNFLPAAVLVTRVISLPAADKICLDLGHKSVAAENEMSRRVFFLNAPELQPISQSEEHLIVAAPENHIYKTGSILYALPFHICPTVALYEKVVTCKNGNITGTWQNIARDRILTI